MFQIQYIMEQKRIFGCVVQQLEIMIWDVISAKSRSCAAQLPITQCSDLVPRNHMCIEINMLRNTLLDGGRAGCHPAECPAMAYGNSKVAIGTGIVITSVSP